MLIALAHCADRTCYDNRLHGCTILAHYLVRQPLPRTRGLPSGLPRQRDALRDKYQSPHGSSRSWQPRGHRAAATEFSLGLHLQPPPTSATSTGASQRARPSSIRARLPVSSPRRPCTRAAALLRAHVLVQASFATSEAFVTSARLGPMAPQPSPCGTSCTKPCHRVRPRSAHDVWPRRKLLPTRFFNHWGCPRQYCASSFVIEPASAHHLGRAHARGRPHLSFPSPQRFARATG